MATRSFIAIVDTDNSTPSTKYKGVYCHWDGYPGKGGVGEMLANHYTDLQKVELLISGGGMSSLAESLEKTEYYSKRGEPIRISTNIFSLEGLKRHASKMGCEYLYVYDNPTNSWNWYKI